MLVVFSTRPYLQRQMGGCLVVVGRLYIYNICVGGLLPACLGNGLVGISDTPLSPKTNKLV